MTLGRFLPLLLIVCLLATQQGSYLHALSHWHAKEQIEILGSSAHKSDPHSGQDHSCKICAAFAVVAAGMAVAGFTLAAWQTFIVQPVLSLSGWEPSLLFVYGSRAPPTCSV